MGQPGYWKRFKGRTWYGQWSLAKVCVDWCYILFSNPIAICRVLLGPGIAALLLLEVEETAGGGILQVGALCLLFLVGARLHCVRKHQGVVYCVCWWVLNFIAWMCCRMRGKSKADVAMKRVVFDILLPVGGAPDTEESLLLKREALEEQGVLVDEEQIVALAALFADADGPCDFRQFCALFAELHSRLRVLRRAPAGPTAEAAELAATPAGESGRPPEPQQMQGRREQQQEQQPAGTAGSQHAAVPQHQSTTPPWGDEAGQATPVPAGLSDGGEDWEDGDDGHDSVAELADVDMARDLDDIVTMELQASNEAWHSRDLDRLELASVQSQMPVSDREIAQSISNLEEQELSKAERGALHMQVHLQLVEIGSKQHMLDKAVAVTANSTGGRIVV
jgi:hypothetical protein